MTMLKRLKVTVIHGKRTEMKKILTTKVSSGEYSAGGYAKHFGPGSVDAGVRNWCRVSVSCVNSKGLVLQ